MIKLRPVKNYKTNSKRKTGMDRQKISAALLRISTDINELNLPKNCKEYFPDPDNVFMFKIIITPELGCYRGQRFIFNFKIGQRYPFEPPNVKCDTLVNHPNIDKKGNIFLSILKEDWKPVFTINSIVCDLQKLLLKSDPQNLQNEEANEVLQNFQNFTI